MISIILIIAFVIMCCYISDLLYYRRIIKRVLKKYPNLKICDVSPVKFKRMSDELFVTLFADVTDGNSYSVMLLEYLNRIERGEDNEEN